jgi:hypothetical protein
MWKLLLFEKCCLNVFDSFESVAVIVGVVESMNVNDSQA